MLIIFLVPRGMLSNNLVHYEPVLKACIQLGLPSTSYSPGNDVFIVILIIAHLAPKSCLFLLIWHNAVVILQTRPNTLPVFIT